MTDAIDIVYTWCDGSDPEFQKERNSLCEKLGLPVKTSDDQLDTEKRYKNNDELLYSLRSVEKYAPWVNHIYIVTNNQRPEWLNDSPKVTVIDQNVILPKKIQPVFNSVAIEQYITEIPGLSENFLYLCDDMFFNRKVKPTDFFRNGKPIVWCFDCNSAFDFSESGWKQTILNAYVLFLTKSKKYYPFLSQHHGIDAYSKSLLQKIFRKYPELYSLNSTPFRSSENVQRILWSYEMAYGEKCTLKHDLTSSGNRLVILLHVFLRMKSFWNCLYSPDKSLTALKISLFLKRQFSFCINNLEGEKTQPIKRYLRKRFPKKSSFEK